MRPAENSTKIKQLTNLIAQTERAYRTSVWVLRNADDVLKPDVKVVYEALKQATDELERIRDRAIPMWKSQRPAAAAKPVDQSKLDAMTHLMPGVAPADAARVISILGEILGAHQNTHK